MTNNDKIIEDLKSSPLVKQLLEACFEKMRVENFNKAKDEYINVIFDVVPYSGEKKLNFEDFLVENENFGVEVFIHLEYPEEDTIEMKVITNVQVCLQEIISDDLDNNQLEFIRYIAKRKG